MKSKNFQGYLWALITCFPLADMFLGEAGRAARMSGETRQLWRSPRGRGPKVLMNDNTQSTSPYSNPNILYILPLW